MACPWPLYPWHRALVPLVEEAGWPQGWRGWV